MSDINARILQQRWTHSHEEDEPGRTIYRPAGWAFPPSRGRKSFELQPNGLLVSTAPGPADRPAEADGRWRLRDDVLELEQQGRTTEMRVLEAAADKLVVQR